MFSKTTQYALRAVIYLAVHSNESVKTDVNTISGALGCPKHFLAKILQKLSSSCIVSSQKGVGGGFFLTKQDKRLPMIKVIECIGGMDLFEHCAMGLPQCSSENPCPIHKEVATFKLNLYNILGYYSIEEIALRVKQGELSI